MDHTKKYDRNRACDDSAQLVTSVKIEIGYGKKTRTAQPQFTVAAQIERRHSIKFLDF